MVKHLIHVDISADMSGLTKILDKLREARRKCYWEWDEWTTTVNALGGEKKD